METPMMRIHGTGHYTPPEKVEKKEPEPKLEQKVESDNNKNNIKEIQNGN